MRIRNTDHLEEREGPSVARESQAQHALQLRNGDMEGSSTGESLNNRLWQIGGEEAELKTKHAELGRSRTKYERHVIKPDPHKEKAFTWDAKYNTVCVSQTMTIPESSATAEATPIRWASKFAASDGLELKARGVGTSCSTTEPVIRLTTAKVPVKTKSSQQMPIELYHIFLCYKWKHACYLFNTFSLPTRRILTT